MSVYLTLCVRLCLYLSVFVCGHICEAPGNGISVSGTRVTGSSELPGMGTRKSGQTASACFVLLLFSRDKVSLCSSGCPGTQDECQD